ncbi:MAG: DUF512 domain-containing protein [Defluviitaleaceae bacterium]|nr:DUF512 domain-containing protein [Defluviitaleaceae bacterium]
MNKIKKHLILSVEDNSIAAELDIEPGDFLICINGEEIQDIFDYKMAILASELELLIEKNHGEEWLLEIEKDEDEDLGLVFEDIMDCAMSCENACIFCFIDQLPPNMRTTLYFKDDDYRLGFLSGNYISLTNLSLSQIERIVALRLSPINISVHTTDGTLRKEIMGNEKADNILTYIEHLATARIELNFQIVLCKGINDMKHLDKSIEDLGRFMPWAKSLSIVPVGLTKYRDNLSNLEKFSQKDATDIVAQVEGWQRHLKEQYGSNFVYAADEFYILSKLPLPAYECYEDFPQLENGVGMMRIFTQETEEYLEKITKTERFKRQNAKHEVMIISIVTGMAAANFMVNIAEKIESKIEGVKIHVFPIVNNTFGENVNISGLLCGKDIIEQLRGKNLGFILLLPKNAMRHGEDVFLDDIKLQEISKALNVDVLPMEIDGGILVKTIADLAFKRE